MSNKNWRNTKWRRSRISFHNYWIDHINSRQALILLSNHCTEFIFKHSNISYMNISDINNWQLSPGREVISAFIRIFVRFLRNWKAQENSGQKRRGRHLNIFMNSVDGNIRRYGNRSWILKTQNKDEDLRAVQNMNPAVCSYCMLLRNLLNFPSSANQTAFCFS